MLGRLPAPLDDDFRTTLVEIARAHRWPSVDEPAKLGPLVASLAAAYNDDSRGKLPDARALLAAKLGWSLPRDVAKSAAAVREAIALELLPRRDRLEVLDLGAGLGATHRGIARALDAAGWQTSLSVFAVDADASAIALLEELARARPSEGSVPIRLRAEAVPIDAKASTRKRDERFDLVLMGQVLSELDAGMEPAARVEAHVALIESLLRETLKPDGVLVVVEPALRSRSRHLQALRGALLGRQRPPRVLGPCLHTEACPLLVKDSDWCHDDLAVDLPPWLVPVARAAGLRFQGLTYSSLLLSWSAPSLRDRLGDRGGKLVRLVSAPMVTKGKREAWVCGDALDAQSPAARGARLGLLDRHRGEATAAFGDAERGDLLSLTHGVDDKGRIGPEHPLRAVSEPS